MRSMKEIKNIIFDWDNTLFPFKKILGNSTPESFFGLD
ncbi:2-haloalkanoic acid dehalogenase [Lactococcus sp. DD01]|nr:2-haloalkanoic acid dehalogenase [Lactococcus sp. DD01]